jgi:hypothetical protein
MCLGRCLDHSVHRAPRPLPDSKRATLFHFSAHGHEQQEAYMFPAVLGALTNRSNHKLKVRSQGAELAAQHLSTGLFLFFHLDLRRVEHVFRAIEGC